MVLFGSFLAWAVFDRISVKRRASLGPLGSSTGGIGGDIAVLRGTTVSLRVHSTLATKSGRVVRGERDETPLAVNADGTRRIGWVKRDAVIYAPQP